MFGNKTLLITGRTGTFGNAVLAWFLQTEIKEIRIFSRDEKKQQDPLIRLANPKVKFSSAMSEDILPEGFVFEECLDP